MPVSSYLPSAQFVLIVTSVALSGGLVLAAQYVTSDAHTPSYVASDTEGAPQTADWKAALYDVQGTDPLAIPTAASIEAGLDALMSEALTSNVTDTIGRSLLLKLGEARSQGLGNDVPTQEKIIAEAAQHLNTNTAPVYTVSNLTVIAVSNAALRTYGNELVDVLGSQPGTTVEHTYTVIGQAVDENEEETLANLAAIGRGYEAIAEALLALPVPQTLSPLHLQVVNNFSKIAGSFGDMQTILADPLRGLSGLQTYTALTEETRRLFTSIAQVFSKNAILFSNDEPGRAWNAILSQ